MDLDKEGYYKYYADRLKKALNVFMETGKAPDNMKDFKRRKARTAPPSLGNNTARQQPTENEQKQFFANLSTATMLKHHKVLRQIPGFQRALDLRVRSPQM